MTSRRAAALPVVLALLAGLAATAVPPAAAQGAPLAVRTGGTVESTVFPNDRFTVPDSAQLTGLRVSLPVPDCTEATRSLCDAVEILNTTDGFDLQPRFFIPFTGDVDVTTVTPESAYVEGRTEFAISSGEGVNPYVLGPYVTGDPGRASATSR